MGRRRSASESDKGYVLSSTLNPDDPIQLDRLPNLKNYAFPPQISMSGYLLIIYIKITRGPI